MRGRSLVTFFLLVIVFSVGGTFLALQFFEPDDSGSAVPRLITVQVVVTATQDPNATIPVRIITATLQPGQVVLPTDILPEIAGASTQDNTDETSSQSAPPATIDAAILTANPELGLTTTSLPDGCILHTIAEGDTPFAVAEQYDANPFALMTINGLDDESASLLQIGDVLIVPLEGCEVAPTPSPTATPSITFTPSVSPTASDTPVISATPTNTLSPTPSPTVTLIPTSSNAQIQIVEVANAGDVTAEGVRIRNQGNTVDVTGWTLSDSEGNEYVFTQQLLFSNAEVTVYTRSGTNTPVALFWGLDEPVWGDAGEILTLRDAEDNVQASLRLSAPIDLN